MDNPPQILTGETLQAQLAALNAQQSNTWKLDQGTLYTRIDCNSFRTVCMYLTVIMLIAESMDHHPHLTQCYNWLEIRLVTHNPQGITNLDLDFARQFDRDTSHLG